MRTLGVRGKNLPAKKTLSVIASDFLIGGMLLNTERKFNKTYAITTPEQFTEIFGQQITSTHYGPDAVKGFFDNVVGVDAKLYIQSLIGYDSGAIDAVVASRNKADDGSDADAYTIQSAYEEELQYGAAGNRIGTKFIQATRFSTEAAATALASAYTCTLDSVIGIRVGDVVKFELTGGGAATAYHTITAIDESARTITWTDAVLHASSTLAIGDTVSVPGFKVETYIKSTTGVETEVDTELGDIICSSESAVTEFYVENVFASSKWVKITEASASTLADRLPADDTDVTYNASGADGTTINTSAEQDIFLANFDDDPIRFLANPETTDETMQKGLIAYCAARDDTPIAIVNIAEDRTKSQLITIGQLFQTSDFSPSVIVANWLEVEDPFNDSANAPNRHVPNVGHVMGAWIWTIGTLGIHFIPATSATTLKGVLDVVGVELENDRDRTDVAEAGVNVIQNITGTGIKIMNLFTTSTDTAYLFGNGILMRNYIKVSGEDSLADTENTPNSLNRINASKMAMLTFLYQLWFNGSTRNVPEGETFGQGQDDEGNPTTPEDHFQVIADNTNNPQANINLGERNIWTYFTFPSPAGSVEIGVGVLLR